MLDEADRMLDMGFVHDVRRITKLLPNRRQTLFFSATMPPEIKKLADNLLQNPAFVEVAPVSSTAERIEQSVYLVRREYKPALLRHVLNDPAVSRVLVFTRTKHGADKLTRILDKYRIVAEAIHGNKSQNARQRSLSRFKDGSCRVLIATDLASRGIDVDDVTHVVNFDLPEVPETYVHRIGRTARAGASGISFSFCDNEERHLLGDIERLIRKKLIKLDLPELEVLTPPAPAPVQVRSAKPQIHHAHRDHRAVPTATPYSQRGPSSSQGGSRSSGPRSDAPSYGSRESRPTGPSHGRRPQPSNRPGSNSSSGSYGSRSKVY